MKNHLSRVALLSACLSPVLSIISVNAQNAPAKVAPAQPTFTSKKYGFALYLPKTPQTQKKQLPAQIGGGSTDIYYTLPQPVSYSIVPIVLPTAAAKVSQKAYFDGVQSGILQSSGGKGKAVSSRDVKVNGQIARDFGWTLSAPTADSKKPVQFSGQTRIYKVGRRTFQFTALVKSAERAKNQAQINKVLGSIVITK